MTTVMVLKSINLLVLFFLNHTTRQNWIQIGIILDVILERLIIISIYPFIITVKKSDELYSKRKLVEYLFKDVGILIGGMFIGKAILGTQINYNTCLIISIWFLILASITMTAIKTTPIQEEKNKSLSFLSFFKQSKMTKVYLLTYFIGTVAMTTGLGLKMLMLTNLVGFTDAGATNYLLIIGLIADLIGILCLRYWQPKNDYITITIKFGIRFVSYVLVFFMNDLTMTMIAITWSILISTAYENVTDAPYINRVPNAYQVLFTDARYLVGVVAESIGMLLAGQMYGFGISYLLGLSAFFMIFQISLCYYLVFLKRKDEKKEGMRFNIPTFKSSYAIVREIEDPLRKI